MQDQENAGPGKYKIKSFCMQLYKYYFIQQSLAERYVVMRKKTGEKMDNNKKLSYHLETGREQCISL